jgi:hypothetical protein
MLKRCTRLYVLAPTQTFFMSRSEPCGAYAVDQKGGGTGLKVTRLYIYPHKTTKTLHLITLGDKDTQESDIVFVTGFVNGVKAEDERSDDRGESSDKDG